MMGLTNKTSAEVNDSKGPKDILASLTQAMQTEDYGDERSERVAGACNLILTTGLSEEKIKTMMAKYKIPKNCKVVAVPKMNTTIWNMLS